MSIWIRAIGLFALLLPSLLFAQNFPGGKPVRIFVGFSPGGGVDTTARMMAQAFNELWGSPVLVENRPGAAGNLANELTVKSPPDGTTMVLCNIGSHAITPARFAKKLSYDPIGDFAFPLMIGGVPNVFMVHPSMPVRSLQQYIDFARKAPGKLNFGSSGVGASPHLSIELWKMMSKINIVHVPYKGASQALTDVISGHIESSVGNLAGAPLAAIKAGRVRALAVTSGVRSPQLPQVPTFAEAGVPGYDVTGWYGLCTQSKVPQPVLTRINADGNKILAGPMKQRLEDQGVTVQTATPEQFMAHVRTEIAKWTKVVADAKLEGD
ncbi:MAG: tripartite tricarboxylate transporter substrate binding protein [Betaproteobacteria bacterium]|nr:tripartite tricarboxylate transporter substrate binding protein [Betaproteobacteria bacterium]